MMTEAIQQHADCAPEGYGLGSNTQKIYANDLVYYPSSHVRDAEWVRPETGDGIIGSRVRDLWPTIMGVAVKRK